MNWRKQTEKPLFEDLIWSRPENKKFAGKLAIIGGQTGEFSDVAKAFTAANQAGAGHIRALLPESLRKLAQTIAEVEFAPTNKSGSFSKNALAEWLDLAAWSDHILLAGDLGKNSETTALIDNFILKQKKSLTINSSSLASIGISLKELINLPVTLVIDRSLLQKVGIAIGLTVPIKSTTPTERLAEIIHEVSQGNQANLVIQDEGMIWVAVQGSIVSTKTKKIGNTELSATCAVWQMQNSAKPLEALSTALFEIIP